MATGPGVVVGNSGDFRTDVLRVMDNGVFEIEELGELAAVMRIVTDKDDPTSSQAGTIVNAGQISLGTGLMNLRQGGIQMETRGGFLPRVTGESTTISTLIDRSIYGVG